MPRAAAAATYYAAREVSRRALAPMAPPPLALALLSASAASAAALVVRAPADVLATRAQVRRRGEEVATTTAEAAAVGFRRWPTLFAAELPYSLLRILGLAALDAAAPAGGGGVLDATERTVAVAVVAALLTTPLDVARTRVLLRTAPGAADAGPPALAATLAEVAAEGSLFSGAALRVAYRESPARRPHLIATQDGIREYEAKNHDYLQAQIGNPDGADKPNKKYYDPRMPLRAAEEATVERLGLARRPHSIFLRTATRVVAERRVYSPVGSHAGKAMEDLKCVNVL